MSIVALKWAYSQNIKNPVAKNVLAFLSSHNFPGNKIFFSVQTICGATAYSRRAVIDALRWLVENKYLIKEIRVSEKGARQSNVYVLNISEKYLSDFCADYNKLSTPPVQEMHPPRAAGAPPPVQQAHPNNKSFNNNINIKAFNKDQKINNQKRHDFANSMDQMANEQKHIEEHENLKKIGRSEETKKMVHELAIKLKRGI